MKTNLNLIWVVLIGLLVASCGVRGQPQPPLVPAELGRGEPGFKRASEEFAFPNIPAPTPATQSKPREESR